MEFEQLKRMSKILSHFRQSFLFFATLFLVLIFVTSQNMICRGDFEGYPIHSAWFGDPYAFVPSNYSCWYTQANGNIQVKKKSTPISSCVAELVSDTKYILCQNIKLEIQNKYQLNFTVLNTAKMSYSKIFVKLNSQLLLSYVTFNQNNVSTATLNFEAPQLDNVLCFDSEFNIWDILYSFQVGPCLDNVTLIKIANAPTTGSNSLSPSTNAININKTENVTVNATDVTTNFTETNWTNYIDWSNIANWTQLINGTQLTNWTGLTNWTINLPLNTSLPWSNGQKEYIKFQINCTTEQVSQIKWEVTFICVLPSGIGAYLAILRSCLQISIGDTATVPFQILQYTETFVKIKLPLSKNKLTLNLDSINMKIQQNAPVYLYNPIPLFYFYMDGIYMNVLKIGEKDASFMKYFSSLSKSLLENSKNIYQILKSNFFSYFLMNIINFWNLSLMYNLLNISIVPMFSKLSLHELTVIFFDLNSILEWLKSRISVLQDFKIPEISSRELIEDDKNRFYWFGTYGLSSKFLENNFQTLLMIVILLLKIGVLFIIKKLCFLPRWLRKKIPGKITLYRLLLIQLISLQVFVIVSAASNLIETGTNEFMGKVNTWLQVMTLMISLIISYLYFLISIQARIRKSMLSMKKEVLKKQKNLKKMKMKRINKNAYYTQVHKTLEMTPIFVVPFVIVLNSTAFFLTVTSVLIIVRIIWFCKLFSRLVLSLDEKIFNIINICFWVLLQLSYTVLFIYQQLVTSGHVLKQTQTQSNYLLIKCCGYGSLIAVVFGGLFEVIRFIVQIIKQGYLVVRKTIKRCTKIRPISQPNNNKEMDVQHQDRKIGVQMKQNVKLNKIQNKDRVIKSKRVRKQKVFQFYHHNKKQQEYKTCKIYFVSQNVRL